VDPAAAKEALNLITNTITCGRVGTAMPTWSEKEGGALNDHQISQLATLINRGDEWGAAAEFAREKDATDVTLTQAVSAEDTTLQVSDASGFSADGVILVDEERMKIQEVHDSALMVERASRGSKAAPHAEDAEVFNQPVPPDPPAVVQQACGQFARFAPAPTTPTVAATEVPGTPGAPTPAPEATATIAAPTGEVQVVQISAVPSMKFDKSELRVKAGGKVTVRFTNDDPGVPHNWALYTDDSASEAIVGANENICAGPCEVEITFDTPPPGEYFFRCDVHPSIMKGTFIVEE
jgi:plastocyanin